MTVILVASAFVAGTCVGYFVAPDTPTSLAVAVVAAAAIAAGCSSLLAPGPAASRLRWLLPACDASRR